APAHEPHPVEEVARYGQFHPGGRAAQVFRDNEDDGIDHGREDPQGNEDGRRRPAGRRSNGPGQAENQWQGRDREGRRRLEARQRELVVVALAVLLASAVSSRAFAQDGTATGHLTLNGETTPLTHAYASAQPGFFDKA